MPDLSLHPGIHAKVRCKVCGNDLFPVDVYANSVMPFMDEEWDEAICLEGTPELEEAARTGEIDDSPFHKPELYWE